MKDINDLCIVGIDDTRPPIINKQPYIDIFFKLSHQAPPEWCDDLNGLMKAAANAPTIAKKDGLYIAAWVRSPDEIVGLLADLKSMIKDCNQSYIDKIILSTKLAQDQNAAKAEDTSKQGCLNRIIESLEFDNPSDQTT